MGEHYLWPERLPRCRGERVGLRWIREEDAPDIFGIFGDQAVIDYWSTTRMQDESAALELIEEIHDYYANRELFQWGVHLLADEALIGTCTLCHFDLDNKRAEVGIALGSKSWGQRLGTETLSVLIEFAFDTLGLERLEADIDPRNARSLALFERQGFKREGLLRERWRVAGEVQDTLMLGLLRREWPRS